MPQRKSAGSLYNACLGFISKNISYWTAHYEEYHLGQGIYRYVLGPFNELNSQLSGDLMALLVQQQQLSRSALHLLLYGGALQKVDLSSCNRIVSDEVVHIVTTACKTLRVLDLSYCKRVTSAGFIAIATNLPHLTALNATKTNLRGQAAQAVFTECVDLQDLGLKLCHVSDEDLAVLCQVAASERGTKLKRLNISYTLVTERGVRSVLRRIPQLQILEFPTLVLCLFLEMDDWPFRAAHYSERFSLRSLQCDDYTYMTNEMLQGIPILCPLVVQLDLRFAGGFNDAGLRHLSQLEHLTDLQLCCEDRTEITFQEGVLPVLRAVGGRLTVLSLQDIDGLDPVAVCQLCPNLHKLVLLMMADGKAFGTACAAPTPATHPNLDDLTELDFWGRNGDLSLSEDTLSFILSISVGCRSLRLIRIDAFTDDVLRRALRNNPFADLRQLSLHECNHVTQESLSDLLLSSDNKLEYVKLINCLQVSRRDYDTWERTAKRERFNLKIEWK